MCLRIFLLISLILFPFFSHAQMTRQALERFVQAETVAKDGEEKPLGDLGMYGYKLRASGEASLNYVFNESPDSFILRYHWELEEGVRDKVEILKGNLTIRADVKGFLAKWSSGECELNVTAGTAPYEIIFTQAEENLVRLDVKIQPNLAETWSSNCRFEEAPGSKFNTKGNQEGMLDRLFQKYRPLLRDVRLTPDRYHKQTVRKELPMEAFLIADPPLGSAEIQGKWVIELIPVVR